MLSILAITSPIYCIIALGYLLTRRGLFSKPDMRVFGKFVLNLALPAMVFQSLAQRPIADMLNPSYLLAYALGSLLVVVAGFWGARRLGGHSATTSTFYAMGMACSNSGFVGFPILLLVLPQVAGLALALNMLVENLLVIPLLLVMAEQSRGGAQAGQALRQSLRTLARNPLFAALLAGLAVSLVGWTLPAPLAKTVSLFAQASGALSLFVIGGALSDLKPAGMAGRVWPIVAGKLLLHPLFVTGALALLAWLGLPALSPGLHSAAIILAAMPMMGIYPTLAQSYGQEDSAAAAALLATAASFFTISGLLWLLHA